MRSLRRPWTAILPVLLLLAVFLPLAACSCGGLTNDPQLVLRSPLLPQSTPIPQATGYAIAGPPAAPSYTALREYSAPAARYEYAPAPRPRAVGPCVDPGQQPYSPPPVPADPNEPPESIPANR